jgi:hypothetical protein
MEKIIRDGMVAVAVSGGFGAGWSTWNDIDPMDARFNQLFLDGKVDEVVRICDDEGLGYAGGARDVEIEWVPIGTEFIITEYDGSESLETKDSFGWKVA